MALKTNFEDADFISSPFVDEIANPGDLNAQGLANDREEVRQRRATVQDAGLLKAIVRTADPENTRRLVTLKKQIKERQIAQRLRDKRDKN